MMKRLIILFFLYPSILIAQLTEDFENGNISNWTESIVGRWAASDISPLNGNYSLHHTYNNASGDHDQVSIALPVMDVTTQTTSWRFRIKYNYNPSGGNNWSIFLMSDGSAAQMNPSGVINGYVLGVNYTGSDDTLRLWRVTSGAPLQIISTTLNWDDDLTTSDTPALEIIRTDIGGWQVSFNKEGDFDNLQNIGAGNDDTFTSANYFGVYYLYTSSADRNLWLDDIYVGKEIKDTISPVIDSLYVINARTLKIEFNEKVDSIMTVDVLNYAINEGIGSPDSVWLDESHTFAELFFNKKFEDQLLYSITIINIEDREANAIADTTVDFIFEYIKPESVEVISADELLVMFSRDLDSVSAENVLNYSLDNGIGQPVSADVAFNDSAKVLLQFGTGLINKTRYKLTIQNIADRCLDSMQIVEMPFLYFIPKTFDLVINEIMADPYPEVDLPNYEYIEIKNTTEFDIDLSNWKLKSGSVERNFPVGLIDSMSYLILCSDDAEEYLKDYGKVLEFPSFPGITNSGTSIAIYDESNQRIDSVEFTSGWYANEEKDGGGWSLERIDPLNTCSGITNWKVSEDHQGGTPGYLNSVFASNVDNDSPEIDKVEILADTLLKIYFNEPLEQISVSETLNYEVDKGIGNPTEVIIHDNLMEVDLTFTNTFEDGITYSLSVKNIEDWCGNFIIEAARDFAYYNTKPFDIVINELMVDPDPVVGLPDFEYIEIFNSSDFDISLANWTITIGTRELMLLKETIPSGDYLVLCHAEATAEFQSFAKTMGIEQFPSLVNSGQAIVLKNPKRQIISAISYTDGWYKDNYKSEGGWSLEQIDPLNPCGGETNWIASQDRKGGTPGQENSVNDSNPDADAPQLVRVSVIDNHNIQLYFSESVDSISVTNEAIYDVDQGIGNPLKVNLISPEYKSLVLGFENSFYKNTVYELEISGGITDCSGNEINFKNTARFAIPDSVQENDLVINEVLFNPLPGGYDFVEVYNRSDKTLDLSDLLISAYDAEEGVYSGVVKITENGYLIFPGEYYMITKGPEAIKEQYLTINPDGFIELTNMPSYNDDYGRVILLDMWQNPIDQFEYDENMHFALLSSNEGVSLERINYDRAANDKTNWHSASELAGFATPAFENSQFKLLEDIEDEVKIEPEVFSPDNDGLDDVTNVLFAFDSPGYMANIKIFDSNGRLIRYLANNKLLGVDGVVSWDGLDDKSQKAPVGIYIVFIEIFDVDGNIKQFKKSVVVATKF